MSNDPAEARKRRKEIIQSQRSENELMANANAHNNNNNNGGTTASATNTGSSSSTAASSSTTTDGINGKNNGITDSIGEESSSNNTRAIDANGADKKPPKKRKVASGDPSSRKINKNNDNIDDINISNSNSNLDNDDLAEGEDSKNKKTQIRYDPDVPMNKDQLAAWRREARRVRNRESAAASRQRIRNRISELEDEVGEWKAKYSNAIQRLEALEKYLSSPNNNNDNGGGEQHQPQPQEQQQQEQEPVSEQQVIAPGASGGTIDNSTTTTDV